MNVQCGNCFKLITDNRVIQYFIDIIESKDPYTQGHSHHVKVITGALIDRLPGYLQAVIDTPKLLTAALLHDIGKITVPDSILNKESGLSDDEWKIMKEHPERGKRILSNSVLRESGDWILYHHERIDGKGYFGIPGDEIPLESKIIAIADTFSALRTYRIYRPAKSIEETIRIMREGWGTQLDPMLTDYFLSYDTDFLEHLECDCDICRQRREEWEKKMGQIPPAHVPGRICPPV